MNKIILCASTILLGTLALENINVEGMKQEIPQPKKIDSYSMFIVSRYLKTINDYINIEKCCKEYNGIIEKYHYNPIPFRNEKQRGLFPNTKYLHIYSKSKCDKTEQFIEKSKIEKIVHWEEVSYSECQENKDEKNVYKNIELCQTDVKKYLLKDRVKEDGKISNTLSEENIELENVLEVNVNSLGNYCFSNCTNLSTITIPTSVSFLGNCCFKNCFNLRSITIPSSVTSIGTKCFYGCSSLTSVDIPTKVKSIGDSCFEMCDSKILSITLPTQFATFKEIKRLEINENCIFSIINNNSLVRSIVWRNANHESIFDRLKGLNEIVLVIPTDGSSTEDQCFKRATTLTKCSNLTSIDIRGDVTSIGCQGFSNCSNLRKITLPTSLKSIGSYCFAKCSHLSEITLPTSLKSIEENSFDGCCNLKSINIPSGVSYVAMKVFSGCEALSEIIVTKGSKDSNRNELAKNQDVIARLACEYGAKTIGYGGKVRVFSATTNSFIKFPYYVGGRCIFPRLSKKFYYLKGPGPEEDETSIKIPLDAKEIVDRCFYKCSSLKEITIPDSVEYIGDSCFENCKNLTSITIPPSVKYVGNRCFNGCSKLISIDIPESVTYIGNECFNWCGSEILIELPPKFETIAEMDRLGINEDCNVNGELMAKRYNATKTLKCISYLPKDICYIGTLIIPKSISSIGDNCFEQLTLLFTVYIPATVTSIGKQSFCGCSKLKEINICRSVTCIGEKCFYGCEQLTSINIPTSVTYIGDSCFGGCRNLTSITLPFDFTTVRARNRLSIPDKCQVFSHEDNHQKDEGKK